MPTTPIVQRLGDRRRAGDADTRLPHERDESSTDADDRDELAPVQAEQMQQALEDETSERQDTDCRSQPPPEGSPCPRPGRPTDDR